MGGEANKLLSQFSDCFISCGVLVHILGLPNVQEDTKWFQGLVRTKTGKGGLTINSDREAVAQFESGCQDNESFSQCWFGLVLDDESVKLVRFSRMTRIF